MSDARELSAVERLRLAERLTELTVQGGVEPVDILAELAIAAGGFQLTAAPAAIWRAIVNAVHAGRSAKAGSGSDAIAALLGVLGQPGYLPGNAELRDVAFNLGKGQRPAVPAARAGGRQYSLFLSYTRVDRDDVDRLYAALLRQQPDLVIYQDYRMPPGTVWLDAVNGAATGSGKMVCWATAAYLRSMFCMYEIGLATAAGVDLVPVFVPATVRRDAMPVFLSKFQGPDADPPVDFAKIAESIAGLLA